MCEMDQIEIANLYPFSYLSEREKEVLLLNYGILTGRESSLSVIGYRHGLTRERVRQIRNEAIAKIRIRNKSIANNLMELRPDGRNPPIRMEVQKLILK